MKIFKLSILSTVIAVMAISCKKEKVVEPDDTTPPTTTNYTVPTTYNFAGASFTNSTRRIAMLGELTTYIRLTHDTNKVILNTEKLAFMYLNANAPFTSADLNTSGISLSDKAALDLQAQLLDNFSEAAATSSVAAATPKTTTASNGVAGKLVSTRAILVDANGFEYKEFVEKQIMGGVFYYQGTKLLNTIATFDNTAVTNGTTAQERAWDEAFGYFGVPIDFPTNVTGLKNWGSYCNAVSIKLAGTPTLNTTIMNAWLKGRAAITNKDNAGRDAARDIVVKTWEKVGAARFITYVKQAKAAITDPASANHSLSEGVGFIRAFKYNSAKTISDADIELLLSYFKTGSTINFYTITTANLDGAINKMATLFSLDANLL